MRFCFHKWTKWSPVIESYGGSQHQVCKCEKCGAITRRTAIHIVAAHLNAAQINKVLENPND